MEGRYSCKIALESYREGQTDGRTDSLTDLMRGTLSRVQHKVGPLCKCSSSSHDWLYNLQRQTCVSTCAHAGLFPGLQKSGRRKAKRDTRRPQGLFPVPLDDFTLERRRGSFFFPAEYLVALRRERVKEGVTFHFESRCLFFLFLLFVSSTFSREMEL